MLVFEERGKLECLEKDLQSKEENQQLTQPTYHTRVWESNPGHIGAPFLLPTWERRCLGHCLYMDN